MIAAAMFSLSRSCIETSCTDFTSVLPWHQMAPHEQTVRLPKDAWQAEKFPQCEMNAYVLK